MPLSKEEIDRLAEDILEDKLIVQSLYCASCGYNLRLRAQEGICPECGSRYNARALSMDGIFLPHAREFPLTDTLGLIVCGLTSAMFIVGSLNPYLSGPLFMGVVTGIMALIFAVRTYRKARVLLRFDRILKHIESDADD